MNENIESYYASLTTGNLEGVKNAISKGIDVKNTPNFYSCPAVFHAITYNTKNSLEIVKLIVENGADVNSVCTFGYRKSPLYVATERKRLDIVKFLVEHGVDVNYEQNSDPNYTIIRGDTEPSNTALDKALVDNSSDIVKYLINNGADIFIKNSKGVSAYDYAETHKSESAKIIKGVASMYGVISGRKQSAMEDVLERNRIWSGSMASDIIRKAIGFKKSFGKKKRKLRKRRNSKKRSYKRNLRKSKKITKRFEFKPF